MSTRRRQSAVATTEVAEPSSSQNGLRKLQFNEPLSWRAGKPIAIGELIRRLTALARELRDMEQEENDRDSFTKVAKELTGHGLLAHKDKGVRAWTACCLVDILKLCAPDAPYTGTQLKDIFTLIISSILPALSDPSNAYNSQHTYVLQSLAQVKSIVLLTDIPSSETLTLQLFTCFFDILSGSSKSSTGEQISKNVEYHMTTVLCVLVDEAPHLPAEIVDIILAQFLRVDPRISTGGNAKAKRGAAPAADERQSTLLLKELPPAYNMAKTICNTCPEKMARYVSQYFNDIIVEASASAADMPVKTHQHRKASNARDVSDDEDGPLGPTEEDLHDLQKAHRLLRELWRVSPAVLQNVLPQLEAELAAENVLLRLLATETLGDMVAGIGAAGPPPPPMMDPTVFPPPKLDEPVESSAGLSILTTPSSPQPFPQTHSAAYHSFLSRKHDRSPLIRAAWATAVGWIISTSAGGIGLSEKEEQPLLRDLATMLADVHEKVRVAAVKSINLFGFQDVVLKLGSVGGVDKEGSVLYNLAGRARDPKHAVRVEGMTTLGRIWGVAAGEIASGNEVVTGVLGSIPSKLFETIYVNDRDINVLLDRVVFESLLPLDYPPSKSKTTNGATNGTTNSQTRNGDSQTKTSNENDSNDLDRIRTERILHLVRAMDVKAKKAFCALQGRQVQLASVMKTFLKRCEEYNGGVMEDNETEINVHLTRLIQYLAATLPEPSKVSADLWKFAKLHDRRSYQLVRFSMDPSSDYRTVVKAIKELRKRISEKFGSSAAMMETLLLLLYRASLLIYNKSHISAVLDISRAEDHPLSQTAQEVLKDMSTQHPEVFKAHVSELCRLLQDHSPTAGKPNDPGALDTLKACAAFANRYPKEMPQDRKFLQSISNYAMYGSPPMAAKYAVSIILTTSERKEMYARDLVRDCTNSFEYGSEHGLAQLAALSQLVLLAPKEAEDKSDAILDIALKEVLLKFRTASRGDQPSWSDDDELDDECKAKVWALKILVNRVRSHQDPKTLRAAADPVYQLLNTLIAKGGESSKTHETPAPHKSRFRLAAARLLLKLCTSRAHDELLRPKDFDRLALTAQDSLPQIRSAFMRKLKKYLGQSRLSQRFYSIVFLQAFEPQLDLREDTVTWIRSRARHFAQKKSTVMESVFARLLSLLAHHPDFGVTVVDLTDFANYVLFYLRAVATEDNLSLVYHVAQRVKQTRDAVSPASSENLYYLSDLAQAVIRLYEDAQGWSMQAWPGKIGLPASLFQALPDHDVAQEIATRSFLPEGLAEKLEALVKAKPKLKRKSDHHDGPMPAKKKFKGTSGHDRYDSASEDAAQEAARRKRKKNKPSKSSKAKPRDHATPRTAKKSVDIPSSEIRRSVRTTLRGKVLTYAESSGSENDEVDEGGGDDDGDGGEISADEDENGDDAPAYSQDNQDEEEDAEEDQADEDEADPAEDSDRATTSPSPPPPPPPKTRTQAKKNPEKSIPVRARRTPRGAADTTGSSKKAATATTDEQPSSHASSKGKKKTKTNVGSAKTGPTSKAKGRRTGVDEEDDEDGMDQEVQDEEEEDLFDLTDLSSPPDSDMD